MKRRWSALPWWGLGALSVAALGCGAADALTSTQSSVSSTSGSLKSGESDYKSNANDTKDRIGNKGQQSNQQGGGGQGGTFTSNGDPDSDGSRGEAKEGKPNEAFNDEVGKKKMDFADWKKWQLDGKQGPIKVKLRWDDPKAELTVEVFDAFGESVASSMGKHRAPERLLTTTIVQPGLYYTKVSCVSAPGSKAVLGTQYTMKLIWEGAPAPAAPASPQAAPAPPACNGPPCVPGQVPCGQPGQPPCAAGQVSCCPPQGQMAAPAAPQGPSYPVPGDPKHPRCKVVQSVRDDDGSLLLFLDRGADAGFKVGMKGTLLMGKDGDVPLDGGEFTITKVIDKQKAVAKCYVSSVGKNNRARVDIVAWHP
jgi:hypothetical protein